MEENEKQFVSGAHRLNKASNLSIDEVSSFKRSSGRPLTVLMTCRLRDLPILELTVCYVQRFIQCKQLVIVSPDADCRRIRASLGSEINVLPENEFIPGMQINWLRKLDVPDFPKAAGWYFQQLLKLQFAYHEPQDDFYLIWDADTIPLQKMDFFDDAGKMLLTKATEWHPPYFDTYRRLFGVDAKREFSFIAQHMVIQKSVCRDMLATIDKRVPGSDSWCWKIMRSLPPAGSNLFSEYETYGHFIKSCFPERINFIDRAWRRELASEKGQPVPRRQDLEELSHRYEYVAFERVYRGWRRLAKWAKGTLGPLRDPARTKRAAST